MANTPHEKLTDVLNKSEPLLGGKINSFAEAYPTISKLRVEITESEMVWPKEHGSWVMTERDFRHAINCSNPVCHGGGIELGWIIHDMASRKLTSHEETRRCRGYEGSPKGRRRDRSCLHVFSVKATVEYKADEPHAGG